MMKNLLIATFALSALSASAQVTFNPSPAQGLAQGAVGAPYSQQITFTVPSSTTVDASALNLGITIPIPIQAQVDVSSVSYTVDGLPSGLSASCTPPSCSFNAGQNGIITISGTPTVEGTSTVDLTSSLTGTANIPAIPPLFAGGAFPIPAPVPNLMDGGPYSLKIQGFAGLEELNSNEFSVVQNYPNPFNGFTTITFNSIQNEKLVMNVYNSLGALVMSHNINSNLGKNNYNLDCSSLASGNYIFTLSNGSKVFSKMMTVK